MPLGSNMEKEKDTTDYGSVEVTKDGGMQTPSNLAATSHVISVMLQEAADERLLEEERVARKKANRNFLYLIVANFVSSCIVFLLHIVSFEMIVSVALSIGTTVALFHRLNASGSVDGSVMNFILLSFAVITPLSASITFAFRRRDEGLYFISILRTTLIQLYSAHANWDWGFKDGTSGRKESSVNWLQHSDKACMEILNIGHEFTRYLTLPNSSRARHKVLPFGKRESKRTNAVGSQLYHSVLVRIAALSDLCEIMKREGLPPNEATRVRQWERVVQENCEKTKAIKDYRTPQALRSYGRLFSMLLPPFYSPFFAGMGIKLNSLAMGITFAVLTAIALTGLFETVSQFEDPFVESSVLDGVQVRQLLVDDLCTQLLALRIHYFPNASAFQRPIEPRRDSMVSAAESAVRLLNNDP